MAPKTTSKAEKAREEELEKGRIAAMKASNAEDPLWKMQRKEQALASDLGIDPDLKAKEFLNISGIWLNFCAGSTLIMKCDKPWELPLIKSTDIVYTTPNCQTLISTF